MPPLLAPRQAGTTTSMVVQVAFALVPSGDITAKHPERRPMTAEGRLFGEA